MTSSGKPTEMMYVVKNATRDNIGVASRGLMEKE